jgi:hypothetical protein
VIVSISGSPAGGLISRAKEEREMGKQDKQDVTKRTDTAPTATANFFLKYGQAASNRGSVGDLLKYGKDGIYTAGRENREIKLGTNMVGYMETLRCGYIHWQDGFPIEEVMGLVAEGFVPPKRDALGDSDKSLWEQFDGGEPRDPWQFSNTLVLYDRKAEQFYTFATSSRGGLGALGELSKDYGQHLRQAPGEWPVVALEGDSYQHRIRSRGRIKFPIFRVVGWAAAKDQPALGDAEQPQVEQGQKSSGF